MKRFLKVCLSVVLLLALLATAAFAEGAVVKTQYRDGSLKLRAGAGKNYAVNGYVKDGDAIDVLEKGDVWSKVKAVKSGKTGYIKNIYIKASSSGSTGSDMVRGKNVYVSENGGSLKVRSGAGTNYAVNGYVQHGDAITILSLGDRWSMIRVEKNGVVGFIRNEYIYGYGTPGWSTDAGLDKPTVSTYDAATVITKYATSTVNLRKSASASSDKVGEVKRGAYLKVTGSEGNWYKVTTRNGVTGYISKSYVSLGATGRTVANLNVRQGAGSGTAKLATLAKGTSVTILSVDGNWAKIRYGKSSTGYVSIRYLNY